MIVGVHRRRNAVASAVAATTREVTTGAHAWPWEGFDVAAGAWSPAVDLIDRPGEVVVRADLPGLDREGVQLTAEPKTLHLRGVRRMNADTLPGDSYHCVERRSGPFGRTIRLPAAVDPRQMTATVTRGVLEVRLPKRADAASQSLEVQTDEAAAPPGAERAAGSSGPDTDPVGALHTA